MVTHLRIARPVTDLARARRMYGEGLQLVQLGAFEDHDGFDGVMLGAPGAGWHLEFTVCRRHPVSPAPTDEDLLVLYLPEPSQWREACARMVAAGFLPAASFNPYWEVHGRTFVDADGYRVVLQNARWGEAAD
ncbi:MAG: VOC family protein [Planctomycetes bacterium]|nr:VOC family protein [Planctomycetota bacterium]MCB9886098.1 VOC family protein [Planctomycetota bacterium]